MPGSRPDYLEPERLAQAGQNLTGCVELSRLARLCQAYGAQAGEAEYALYFAKDAQARHVIRGSIAALLSVLCNRCLKPMSYRVKVDVALAIVRSESQALNLPADYDPLVVEERLISLNDLIEDEVLLALPLAPLHDAAQCEPAVQQRSEQDLSHAEKHGEGDSEKENPFAILSELKL